MKPRFPYLTADEWFEHYRISVINVRQILDWAGQRPEIDSEKIALFGLSLGGFISAITMGIDKRIKAGVLVSMGGNSAKISQLSPRWSRHGFKQSEDEYEIQQKLYAGYVSEVTRCGYEAIETPQQAFLNDPLTFASFLQERPLRMFNAYWDEAIPHESTIDFWEACGRPPITWLPAAHATIWIWYPLISRQIRMFLENVFKSEAIAK